MIFFGVYFVKRNFFFLYTFWHFLGYMFYILSIFQGMYSYILGIFWGTFLESWRYTPVIIIWFDPPPPPPPGECSLRHVYSLSNISLRWTNVIIDMTRDHLLYKRQADWKLIQMNMKCKTFESATHVGMIEMHHLNFALLIILGSVDVTIFESWHTVQHTVQRRRGQDIVG